MYKYVIVSFVIAAFFAASTQASPAGAISNQKLNQVSHIKSTLQDVVKQVESYLAIHPEAGNKFSARILHTLTNLVDIINHKGLSEDKLQTLSVAVEDVRSRLLGQSLLGVWEDLKEFLDWLDCLLDYGPVFCQWPPPDY